MTRPGYDQQLGFVWQDWGFIIKTGVSYDKTGVWSVRLGFYMTRPGYDQKDWGFVQQGWGLISKTGVSYDKTRVWSKRQRFDVNWGLVRQDWGLIWQRYDKYGDWYKKTEFAVYINDKMGFDTTMGLPDFIRCMANRFIKIRHNKNRVT